MPTNTRGTLPRLPQCAVEDLDVRRRTLALMRDVTVRQDVRDEIDSIGQRERRNQWLRTDGRRGLEIAAQDVALLLSAGASRAEVMLLPTFLLEIIEDLCDEGVGGDRLALELEHMRLDAEEDLMQGPALVEKETPEAMLARAHALRREGAAALALARHLEGIVRRRTLHLMARTA